MSNDFASMGGELSSIEETQRSGAIPLPVPSARLASLPRARYESMQHRGLRQVPRIREMWRKMNWNSAEGYADI
jgi:hypothetical protein